jgi:hypothetical protein
LSAPDTARDIGIFSVAVASAVDDAVRNRTFVRPASDRLTRHSK